MRKALELALSIFIAEAAGAVGSLFTVPAISGWYATLARPALAPPNWVFGPVWTTLFALMGTAAYMVWRLRREHRARIALCVYAAQLVLNVLWSALFFGLRNPGAALVEIAALWVAIALTAVLFYRVSRGAAYLLLPYLMWVSFAAYLNWQIWLLN
jgi:translocator protein